MNELNLYQKRAVITGAASGIGRALSIALAKEGCFLTLSDVNEKGLTETLELVQQAGGKGEVFICDVSNIDDVRKMADHCFNSGRQVDLLVNNAGVAATGITGKIPLEDWKWIFSINFWGVLYGCHSFIPRMKNQNQGHILNVASIAGLASLPEMGSYNTSKAAVVSLSETLRSELAPNNIGVSVLCPSNINTHLLDHMKFTDDYQKTIATTGFQNALITPGKVAEIVVKAIKKNRFYIVPQFPAKLTWVFKRLSPTLYFKCLSFLMRASWGKKVFLQLNRIGF